MTACSASVIGVPRSFMFFRLSAHSPRESGVRRMCCSSWQILHLVSVRVEPGPEMSLSCPQTGKARASRRSPSSRLNKNPHAMPAVPEVAERIPRRHRGLRVARRIPRAREEGDVARVLRLVLVGEGAPRERMQGLRRRELRALPGLAFVARDLDALDRAFAHPRAA